MKRVINGFIMVIAVIASMEALGQSEAKDAADAFLGDTNALANGKSDEGIVTLDDCKRRIASEGTESIPFLRETIANEDWGYANRYALYRHLKDVVVAEIKIKNQDGGAEMFHTFLAEMEEAEPGDPIDDATLKEKILTKALPVQELVYKHKVPREKMARFLQDIIRERIPILERDRSGDSEEYDRAWYQAFDAIGSLCEFRNLGATAVLKECILCDNYLVAEFALKNYIAIEGSDVVPFLLDTLAKRHFTVRLHYFFSMNLNSIIAGFKQMNNFEDSYAFFITLALLERSPISAQKLDSFLCESLPEYASSVQRERAIKKFLTQKEATQFHRIQAEIVEAPAEQRIDLGKRFALQEQRIADILRDEAFFSIIERSYWLEDTRPQSLLEFMDKYEKPTEWGAKMLREAIREGLSNPTGRNNGGLYTINDAIQFIPLLETLHDPDALALLKECVLSSENETVRCHAMKTYIVITGVESIPFLREVIEKKSKEDRTHLLRTSLNKAIGHFKEHGGGPEIERFYVFLSKTEQVEQDSEIALWFDQALCESYRDYVSSIQHRKIAQKFLDSTNPGVKNYFVRENKIIKKIPADRRKDLSKQFALVPVPRETKKD